MFAIFFPSICDNLSLFFWRIDNIRWICFERRRANERKRERGTERGGGPSVHEASRRRASIACPRGGRHHVRSTGVVTRGDGLDFPCN